MSQMTQVQTVPEWTLGDRLRKAREAAGYASQKDFAKATGISRGTVSSHEAGKRPTNARLLRQWARETGVSEEWLRTGAASGEQPGPEGEPLSRPTHITRPRAKAQNRCSLPLRVSVLTVADLPQVA